MEALEQSLRTYAESLRGQHATRNEIAAELDRLAAQLPEAIAAWNRRAPSANPPPASLPGVVKALEWECGVVDWARPLPGMKYVACSTTPQGSWGWWLEGAPETRSVHPSEAEAKAAAQADFDRRILSQIDFAALAAPVSQEPVAVPFPGSIMCGCDGATCPDGCKHCNPDLQRKAIEELASQFGASPLTEGEPSEAEVERAAKAVVAEWKKMIEEMSPHMTAASIARSFVSPGNHRLIRAALLAAKSKGGQADG